ncbi:MULTISPECIES: helix-turn-helix domain-containing protein [Bradyrhizobium]|uniref:helix-turn-helix domain-containing protein n=1 Tax=Bradyrhizobium elkanii TaxID=29448 RepID=UPI00042679E7|nr:helix-turn-helix domain-containing protein [Bradyrhizobium elkanii]
MIKTNRAFAKPASITLPESLPSATPMPVWRDALRHSQALDVGAWHETLHSTWGRYTPVVNDPKSFVAKIRAQSLYGLSAMHLMPNASRVERTQRDARVDGMDHYYALFSVVGTVKVLQNDQAIELNNGQVLLVDSARSVSYVADQNEQRQDTYAADRDAYRQCFVLQLPRQSLVSHLGFEPQYGPGVRWDTPAGRALFKIVSDAVDEDVPMSGSTLGYMRLVIYDLIGAIFSPPDPATFFRSEKLFQRVCNVVKNHFEDPNVTPDEVATEVGISRRYLQKLFAMRNLTYTHFINSVRLDHAARLLRRRAVLGTTQPISAIAYSCGFGNYANFARQFRNRFGHAPAVHAKGHDDDPRTGRLHTN